MRIYSANSIFWAKNYPLTNSLPNACICTAYYAVYVQIHTFCATPLLTGGELIDMVGESTDGG